MQKIKIRFITNILVNLWRLSHSIKVKIAVSPKELEEVFHLRWEIYIECGYIESQDFPDQKLKDKYDTSSLNVIAFKNNVPVGTVRLILSSEQGFPTERAFNILNFNFPRNEVGEISKLGVKKNYKKNNFRKKIFIILISEIYKLSKKNKINYWLIGIPPFLKNYIEKLNFHVSFQELKTGPLKLENVEERKTAKKYFENYQITPFLINIQKL